MTELDQQVNELFQPKEVAARVDALLDDLVMRTCRTRLSVSRADIEALEAARERTLRAVTAAFDLMIGKAECRRGNLPRYAGVQVVSLGEDCLARTLATHWGLKPGARMGERSHPFDLAVHPVEEVRALIESGFADYLDPANLAFSDQQKIVFDRQRRIYFNHEVGVEFAENEFALLRETYRRRIEHFHADTARAERLLLLLHIQVPGEQTRRSVEALSRTVTAHWGGKDHRFVCINTWPADSAMAAMPALPDPRHAVIDLPYPFPGYVWHLPAHCFSPGGQAFERAVVARIDAVLADWLAAAGVREGAAA